MPPAAKTHAEAQKTPRIRSFRVLGIILAVLGVLIGAISQRMEDSAVRNTFILAAVAALPLLVAIAFIVQWYIFYRKK